MNAHDRFMESRRTADQDPDGYIGEDSGGNQVRCDTEGCADEVLDRDEKVFGTGHGSFRFRSVRHNGNTHYY